MTMVMEVHLVRLILSLVSQLEENDDLFRSIAVDQNEILTITMTQTVLKKVFAKRMESVSFELEMISSRPLRIITSQQRKFACPTKEGYIILKTSEFNSVGISVHDLKGILHMS